RLARPQIGQRRRIAAPERGGDGLLGQIGGLACPVEVRGDGIAAAAGRWCPAARRRLAGRHAQRRLAVLLLHPITDGLVRHGISPLRSRSWWCRRSTRTPAPPPRPAAPC